jgi:uncharacterized membrane protein
MNQSKVKLIAYWIVTVLVAAGYYMGGVLYVMRGQQVIDGAKALGYPLYFMVLLGVWKILGATAILLPKTPVIKEWAYAGMFINLTGAVVSNYVMGMGAAELISPLINLALVIASWALRPASRRFEKPFWS